MDRMRASFQSAAVALAGLCALTACGSARGAPLTTRSGLSQQHATEQSPALPDTGHRRTDSLDRALDRVDAAHAALDAADAQVAVAMRALNAALDDVARLGGDVGPETWHLGRGSIERDADRVAERAAEEGERMSRSAQQIAMRNARIAMGEARRELRVQAEAGERATCQCAHEHDDDGDADDGDADENP